MPSSLILSHQYVNGADATDLHLANLHVINLNH